MRDMHSLCRRIYLSSNGWREAAIRCRNRFQATYYWVELTDMRGWRVGGSTWPTLDMLGRVARAAPPFPLTLSSLRMVSKVILDVHYIPVYGCTGKSPPRMKIIVAAGARNTRIHTLQWKSIVRGMGVGSRVGGELPVAPRTGRRVAGL